MIAASSREARMGFSLFKKKPAPAAGSAEFNESVRVQLARMGDDGASTRHVVHYAYPSKTADPSVRSAMIGDLRTRGFDVKDAVVEQGVVFEHHRPVTPHDFDAVTNELREWFATRGWGYDGWECAVVSKNKD
jgi:hypothetical protein